MSLFDRDERCPTCKSAYRGKVEHWGAMYDPVTKRGILSLCTHPFHTDVTTTLPRDNDENPTIGAE